MRMEEILTARLSSLIEKADSVLATHRPNDPGMIGFSTLDPELTQAWKASSENIIATICSKESSYYQNFIKETKRGEYRDSVRSGKGILQALKEDVEAGLITNIKFLAVAEVFVNFIEMAAHLLTQGYKDPAASLIGAVLEDSLRKIAENNEVAVKNSDDISALNNKLADKGAYNRIVQKQIHAWKAIRDHADHGKFDEYSADDVADLIKGVTRFVAENQK